MNASPDNKCAAWGYSILVFAVLLLNNLWEVDRCPLAGTEGHRAIAAHQMVESGRWLVPKLYDQVYLRKPPLHYWMLAGLEKITGLSGEWIWRLPSVLSAALTAAFLCFMGARWFGPPAGLVSGLSYLALLVLWSQNRSADVDAVNTLFSVIAACSLIELRAGRRPRPFAWSLGLAASFGTALLVKGPACLPLVIGTVIGLSLVFRSWSWLRRPAVWGGLALGLLIFLSWAVTIWTTLRAGDQPLDLSGVDEATSRIFFTSLKDVPRIVSLPVILLVYGLPMSFVLLFACHSALRLRESDSFGPVVRSLTASFFSALLVGIPAGLHNPRYGYIVLPLLCPLAGVVASALQGGRLPAPLQRSVLSLTAFSALGFTALHLGLLGMTWRSVGVDFLLIAAGVLALALCATALTAWLLNQPIAIGRSLILLLLLTTIPFARFNNERRTHRSGLSTAQALRRVVKNSGQVSARNMVFFQPEIFYYAGVRVDALTGSPQSRAPEKDCWMVLHWKELQKWQAEMPGRLSCVTRLPTAKMGVYAAWYTAPQSK